MTESILCGLIFSQVLNFIGFNSSKDINKALGHRRAEHAFYINSTQFSLCTAETYDELIAVFHLDEMNGFIQFEELRRIDNEYRTELISKMNSQYPSIFNLWEGGKSKSNILEYAKDGSSLHPTQKPVLLLEDLIKTFSNFGDTVLDCCMGSGSTGVACLNTGRRFIGMELDPDYFDTAKNRIGAAGGAG